MDYKVLAKNVHKQNRNIEFAIMMLIAMAGNFVMSSIVYGICISSVEIIYISWELCESYLKINGSFKKDIKDLYLYDIVKMQSFDTKSYFGIITKKMLPLMAAMIMVEIAGFLLNREYMYLIDIVLSVIIPICVIYFSKKRFEHNMTHRVTEAKRAVMAVLEASVGVAMLSMIAISIILIGIIGFGGFLDRLESGDANNIISMRSYSDSNLGIVIIVLLCLVLIFTFVSRDKIVLKYIRIVLAAAIIILIFVDGFEQRNNNNLFTENEIVTRENGRETVYLYDDVETYTVYDRKGSIGLKLVMNDGKNVEVFTNMISYTDLYTETFSDDYNFTAYLMKKMSEKNIPGKLLDEGKLAQSAIKDGDDAFLGMKKIQDIVYAPQ